MKIVNGFVWKIVTDKAEEIFNSGIFELYTLREDGSEYLIDSIEDLRNDLNSGYEIGIEVGSLNTVEYDN